MPVPDSQPVPPDAPTGVGDAERNLSTNVRAVRSPGLRLYAVRLRPGDDPKVSLDALAAAEGWEAASVVTCVGSLTKAVLRFANQEEATELTGHFEIVSLTGAFSRHGGHYHIAISDGGGRTYGAHLMDGSAVYTTAEIVLAVLDGVRFLRTPDPATGYEELDIQPIA